MFTTLAEYPLCTHACFILFLPLLLDYDGALSRQNQEEYSCYGQMLLSEDEDGDAGLAQPPVDCLWS